VNYNAFVAAIQWREQRRNYIMDIQAAHTRTAAPLIAPVWLLFPGEAACAFDASGGDNVGCAGAFMLGPDWLAKPVTEYGQVQAWVWLPRLPAGQSWVDQFTQVNHGQGGVNVTLATPVSAALTRRSRNKRSFGSRASAVAIMTRTAIHGAAPRIRRTGDVETRFPHCEWHIETF
jgi:alpha-glucosidase (family GH31 glycosyl hydrolase)